VNKKILLCHEKDGSPDFGQAILIGSLFPQLWNIFLRKIWQKPYQRLVDSPHVSDQDKTVIRARLQQLNPFSLKRELETRLKWFFKMVDLNKASKLQAG